MPTATNRMVFGQARRAACFASGTSILQRYRLFEAHKYLFLKTVPKYHLPTLGTPPRMLRTGGGRMQRGTISHDGTSWHLRYQKKVLNSSGKPVWKKAYARLSEW